MRILVHVEGETEESFVHEILRPHLVHHGYSSVSARLLGNARQRSHRGGARSWSSARQEIVRHLRRDPSCVSTTMVDYYGLPATGAKAWPGREEARRQAFPQNAETVQQALAADIATALPQGRTERRFVPMIVMHEFEGLLFSDCPAFARGIENRVLATRLQEIRDRFSSPEEINDSPDTAPSKRVRKLVPGYQKPLFGTLAALEVGLGSMRRECAHFRHWLERLEALPKR